MDKTSLWRAWIAALGVALCVFSGLAALYARLCIVETKVDIVADRVERIERRLDPRLSERSWRP